MLSISGKKEQHLAMFFCFSIPVLNRRAWFSGKPVPQLGKNKKNKKLKKKTPCSFLQEKKKTPTFSTDTTHCSVKEFSLPKIKKNKKEEKTKKTLEAGVDILLSDAVFLLVSDDGLLIINR